MNKVVIALVLILAIAGMVYFGFMDQEAEEGEAIMEQPQEVVPQESVQVVTELANEEQNKLEVMKARFEELKELRKKTSLRISRIASRLRRSEFPPDKAREIEKDMRKISYMLKTPKLLGAFSSVEEIEEEIESLNSANKKLGEIKTMLDEKRKKNAG